MFLIKIRFTLYTAFLFFLLPYLWCVKYFSDPKEFSKKIYRFPRTWGSRIMKWMKADVEISGSENIPHEPVVIIANHQAGFDIPLLFSVMTNRPSFIAKKELSRIPLFASWMRMIGCLFIDRSSPRKALGSFKKASVMIKKGQTVILFPEGTRRPNIIPFKKGSFKLPVMAGVPVLPVTICGTENIIDNFNSGKRTPVKVIIRKPINIGSLPVEEQKNIHNRVREIIISAFLPVFCNICPVLIAADIYRTTVRT